jgi:hypothetical protein
MSKGIQQNGKTFWVYERKDNVEKLLFACAINSVEHVGFDDFGHYKHNGHSSYRRDSQESRIRDFNNESEVI